VADNQVKATKVLDGNFSFQDTTNGLIVLQDFALRDFGFGVSSTNDYIFRLLNSAAGTINLNVEGGGTFGGDVAVNGGDITSSSATLNCFNTTSTTVNAFGKATALTVGEDKSGTTTVRNKLVNAFKTDTAGTGTIDTAGVNVIYLNPTGGAYNLTTLSNGADGQRVTLINIHATNAVTIKDGTGNIQCAADVTLGAKGCRTLVYSSALTAWVMDGNNTN
jgi:hypothetical protein